MAGKMTPEAEKRLTKDVRTILRVAKRKTGATGEQICEALGIKADFMAYRYRRAIKLAVAEHGLSRDGHGKGSVWRA